MGTANGSTEEKIWDFLKGKGLNNYGIAGLMGNLYAESGLSSINLQNTYEKKLGMTDDTYTTSVDNGDYENFVHDGAGYGLAQWTYHSRKQGLLNLAKTKNTSVGDLETQLEYLYKELSTGYKAVLSVLKTAASVRAASDAVLTKYERPADQSTAVQKKRAEYGQIYYSKYAGGNNNMAKNISTGYISEAINGIEVNSSIPCNTGNYESVTNRSVAYVVMHYTGNTKDIAKNNANYFATGGRNASAHLFVDDDSIYQSVKLKDKAWHCGTSGTYYHKECRNANSIGIEMCCTAGNYKISDTTKKNAAYLCTYICKLLGISAGGVDTYVVRHYDVTHKNCPAQMAGANNTEWNAFKTMVKDILNGADDSDDSGSGNNTSFPDTPFTVQVIISDLNYRSEPSMSGKVLGQTGKGVFTITAVKDGWGKLKSGAGWIYLENSSYVTIKGKTTSNSSTGTQSAKKSVDEIAKEVIAGKWGNGAERKKKLEAAGYSYAQVQAAVNRALK